MGRIFLKIQTSYSPRMRYKEAIFFVAIGPKLRELYSKIIVPFRLLSRLPFEGFSCKFIPRTLNACTTNGPSVVSIGRVNGTFVCEQCAVSSLSSLPSKGLSWKFTPRTLHTCCKLFEFGRNRSLFNGTFLGEQCAVSGSPPLSREGFYWKLTPRTLHSCATNAASLVPIGHSLRGLYFRNNVPFQVYFCRDFRENTHLVLSMHVLKTMQVVIRQ
jgi:hypothetical protein